MKIPVKKYVDDIDLSFDDRFYILRDHHEKETAWLINRVRELEDKVCGLERELSLLPKSYNDL